MKRHTLLKMLRFYFITDDNAPNCPPIQQTRIALEAGATMIQYRNKSFSDAFLPEILQIRSLCSEWGIPLLINDDIGLAERVGADGIHVGQQDISPTVARQRLGGEAIIGVSVSSLDELRNTDLSSCDYIGTGPIFPTGTKTDAKAVKGLSGLKAIVDAAPIPVVAIGGIAAHNTRACLDTGAAGIAVISFISRAIDPRTNAVFLGQACGVFESHTPQNP